MFLLLIVVAGATESSGLFRLSLGLFGFGAGVSTNACLTLMLGLTSPLLAGTFIGIWGVAQAYSRGIATVAGGSVLSGAGLIWGSETSFGAYASVFVLQALGLLVSGVLLLRVDTSLFKERIERTLGSLVAHELD